MSCAPHAAGADSCTGWAAALPPTRDAALARIARVDPSAYARTRNHLDGAVTGLSPYITHGVVTLREVLDGVLRREPLGVQHRLVSELGWREYFRHVWAQRGNGILQSLHPGPLTEADYAPALPAAIREARTGVAVIDAAVRTLYATGTLHNHARLWLASYAVHVCRSRWRAGADWLVAHLLDGDLASNHLSWQWVAGTGSHKPYLFNADNVARHAPPRWHSAGSVIDIPYELLDRIARGVVPAPGAAADADAAAVGVATPEPALLGTPPAGLVLQAPTATLHEQVRGREVWLVHPWGLRSPPAGVSDSAVRVGVYLQEYHAAWPWPEARWRWVDAAMAAVTQERWFVDAADLAAALHGAAGVRSIDEPHLAPWLGSVARLKGAPRLFPVVERRCASFSRWWAQATQGLVNAEELL